jgi:hypothetical protein
MDTTNCSKRVGGKTRLLFGAAAVVAAVCLAFMVITPGCVAEPDLDDRLINVSGEAWTGCQFDECVGLRFRADGGYLLIIKELEAEIWEIDHGKSGEWSTFEGELRMSRNGKRIYSVSGDTLTLWQKVGAETYNNSYVKTSGIIVNI